MGIAKHFFSRKKNPSINILLSFRVNQQGQKTTNSWLPAASTSIVCPFAQLGSLRKLASEQVARPTAGYISWFNAL